MIGQKILTAVMHDPMFRAANNPLCHTFIGTPRQKISFGLHVTAVVPKILEGTFDQPADLPTIFACISQYRQALTESDYYERIWDRADDETRAQFRTKTMFANMFRAASRSVSDQTNDLRRQLLAMPANEYVERHDCFCRALGLTEDNQARIRAGTLTIEQLLESQPSVIIGFGNTSPREC